ncbi:MAG: cytochrome c biogenesis CcdA family protein [Candidatus Pacearchaeota archaeon]
MEIANLWISFLAGLSAPLVAACVLPLYPGFLAYLSKKVTSENSEKQENSNKKEIIKLGAIASAGIIISMFIVGLIFTGLLQNSLTNAIEIISPTAFGILTIVSLMLIFNFDFSRYLPRFHAPTKLGPKTSALMFGLFFGAIVLPCNPAPLVVLFAVSTSTISFLFNLLNFVLFGIGMALPLLAIAIASGVWNKNITTFFTKHTRKINIAMGLIMLGVSIYYLFFVFEIQKTLL